MKGKIGLSLFGLPFFAVGVWMSWSIGSTSIDAQQMRDWQATPAQLQSAGYNTSRGDDSDTYEAYASYTYTFAGQTYSAKRVGINGGTDNIGDYQVDMGNRLSRVLAAREPITVFVNPEHPAEAIIDRELRWSLLGFKAIFLFVFGGVGLALLIYAWRLQPPKPVDAHTASETPWLQNPKWTTPSIRSGSRASMWGAIGFAVFWNLVSAPLPFLVYEEVLQKDNKPALLGLLFPAIGIMLLVWALRRTFEWRRFGPTLLTMDPFPGSIGGHVGGTIDLNLPFDPAQEFEVSLTCLHSYLSSGKNRSRRESAEWQDSTLAHAEPFGNGTRLSLRFAVPAGLRESAAARDDDSYYLWRVSLSANLPGTDLDRDYDVPVYSTGQLSHSLPEMALQNAETRQAGFAEQRIRELFQFEQSATGKRMHFPMGQQFGAILNGVLIGGIFAVAGWFLMFRGDAPVFGFVFGGVGGIIALASTYMLFKSLDVYQESTAIVSVRRFLGIPLRRRRMERHRFAHFRRQQSLKTQSGGKHVIHYSLYAVDQVGNELLLGEGFSGESDTNAAEQFIAREFNLQIAPGQRVRSDSADSPGNSSRNFLAGDS